MQYSLGELSGSRVDLTLDAGNWERPPRLASLLLSEREIAIHLINCGKNQ
jgi:hypothetical protein